MSTWVFVVPWVMGRAPGKPSCSAISSTFSGAQTPDAPITSQLVLDWLDTNFSASPPARNAQRLDTVRQFLTHLSAEVPGTEIPEFRLFARYPRPKPFLFSTAE